MMRFSLTNLISLLIVLTSFGQKGERATVTVLSINFDALTSIGVPCEKFRSVFGDRIKSKIISAKDSIMLLESFIQKIRFKKGDRDSYIDTRARITYHTSRGNDIVFCVNSFNYVVDGLQVKKDSLLFNFILSMIPEEHRGRSNRFKQN